MRPDKTGPYSLPGAGERIASHVAGGDWTSVARELCAPPQTAERKMGYDIPEDHHGPTPGEILVAENNAIDQLAREVASEVRRAQRKHAPMNSPHEGWSVIYEELEELREHVRADTGRSADARKEAIQIAAMGIRYALNLCR